VLWSDYAADNSDTGSAESLHCGGAQESHADAPWSFLFEFAEPETCHPGGAAGEITDDTSDADDELEPRDSLCDSMVHLAESASCSSRSGWRLSHRSVPKSTNLCAHFGGDSASSTASSSGIMPVQPAAGGVTTLMLRHLPNMYTRSMLVEELDHVGLGGSYDFLYLPIDKNTRWNVGYAFVNFISPAAASKCVGLMTDYVFKCHSHNSGKVTQVAVAHIQGLDRNLEFFSNRAVQLGSRFNRPLVCAAKADAASTSSSKGSSAARRRRRPKRRSAQEPPAPAAQDGTHDDAPGEAGSSHRGASER